LFFSGLFFVPLGLILELKLGIEDALIFSIITIPLTLFPDSDKNFVPHRNWFTHSILMWVIFYVLTGHISLLLSSLCIGYNDFCDINVLKRKRKGFYTISFYPFKLFIKSKWKSRLTGKLSTVWLGGNFFVSVLLLVGGVLVY